MAFDAIYLAKGLANLPQQPFGDFFSFWSFGKFAAAKGSEIYDPLALQAFETALSPDFRGFYPYWNPPSFLLLLAPLAMIPLAPAYVVWALGTFMLSLIAALGRDWRSLAGVAALAAPSTLINAVSGQNGFLSAALIVGGLRAAHQSPVFGGILLGLLTYKPQFALLIPVALLARRNWRAIASSFVTFLTTVVMSSLFFGDSIWVKWIHAALTYGDLLRENSGNLNKLMPTFLAGLHEIGLSGFIADGGQVIIYIVVAVILWRALKIDATDRGTAATIVGSFIVAPYAFIYDTPMITSALLIEWKRRRGLHLEIELWQVNIVLAIMAFQLAMIAFPIPFALFVTLAALFWAILRSPSGESGASAVLQ